MGILARRRMGLVTSFGLTRFQTGPWAWSKTGALARDVVVIFKPWLTCPDMFLTTQALVRAYNLLDFGAIDQTERIFCRFSLA